MYQLLLAATGCTVFRLFSVYWAFEIYNTSNFDITHILHELGVDESKVELFELSCYIRVQVIMG